MSAPRFLYNPTRVHPTHDDVYYAEDDVGVPREVNQDAETVAATDAKPITAPVTPPTKQVEVIDTNVTADIVS